MVRIGNRIFFRRIAFGLLLLWALLVMAAPVAAAPDGRPLFAAHLTGAAERPNPGDPDGSGYAVITLNQGMGEVCWEIFVENITLPATAAHIHVGAAGVPGPVVVGLSAPGADGIAKGCRTGVAEALIKAIRQNPAQYYVNVHNVDFPGGALRDQLSK